MRITTALSIGLLAVSLTACGQDKAQKPKTASADAAKKAEGAKKDAKKAEPKKAEPKKEEPKKAEPVMLELGKAAPDFTLTDTDGKEVKLSAFKGKTVVLEWFNPGCPFVKKAHGEGELKTMAKDLMGDDLVWLSINSGAPGKQGAGLDVNKKAKEEFKMDNAILLDESGKVGKMYGATNTPHMFVVNTEGNLIYRGAIDNAPMNEVDPERPKLKDSKEGELINYVKAAHEDLKGSRDVQLPETKAYGCSVKYAKA